MLKRLKTLARAVFYFACLAAFFVSLLVLTTSFRYSGGPT